MLNKEMLLAGGKGEAIVTLSITYVGGEYDTTSCWIQDTNGIPMGEMKVKRGQSNTLTVSVPVGTIISYDGGGNPPIDAYWAPQGAAVPTMEGEYPYTWLKILGDVHITDKVWHY